MTKKSEAAEAVVKRVFTHLDPGTYVLTQDWKPTNPDRRRTGQGIDTPQGFRKGTRFEVREDRDVHAVSQHAGVSASWYQLWPLSGRCIASGNAQGWTVTESVERLILALEPDLTNQTWIDTEIGLPARVLEHLLSSGSITREQVRAANAAVEAAIEAEAAR
jgi:hypothetical protein